MALPIGVKSYELRDISMPKLSNPGGRQARVALNAAKAAGVSVKLNGGKLSLKASGPPPEAVVAALKNHKAEIVALLKAEQAAFDERAAIIEFGGGAPRIWAEELARLDPACPQVTSRRHGGCNSSMTAGGSSMTAGRLVPRRWAGAASTVRL